MGHGQRSEGKLVYLETVYCVLCVGDVSLKSHWLQAIGRRVSPTSRVLVFHIMSRWALIWGNSGATLVPCRSKLAEREQTVYLGVFHQDQSGKAVSCIPACTLSFLSKATGARLRNHS